MSAHAAGARTVLVVGDANTDLVLTGDVVPRFGQREQLLDAASVTIGGSASITAHGLARLGRPVRLVAALGDDGFGRRVAADLASAGVDITSLRWRPDVPTGLSVVLSRPDDRAILTLPGAIPTLTVDEVMEAVRDATPDGAGVAHVHVASLFLQPRLAEGLRALLAELRDHRLTTSLDTGDDPAQEWRRVRDLLPLVDVFLPNRAEVVALAGLAGVADAQAAARSLAGTGALVVVKDGAAGAFAATPGGELVVEPASVVTAIDTTGAGDTFDAAFLDSWLDERRLPECLSRAVRAGALAVQAVGGVAGQPLASDLNETEPKDAVRR
ncbi:MAG: carbohydrate kinase family protein [Actinomycetales bacterium]